MAKLWIIDVRTPAEFSVGHAKDAINIPVDQIHSIKAQSAIGQDDQIIVYCATGGRSEVAKNLLNGLGFGNVTNGVNNQEVNRILAQDQ